MISAFAHLRHLGDLYNIQITSELSGAYGSHISRMRMKGNGCVGMNRCPDCNIGKLRMVRLFAGIAATKDSRIYLFVVLARYRRTAGVDGNVAR
jgi:hypothetical protein